MDVLLMATFVVAFLSSIISGISGGGGGFIMTPFYLFVGLSPQQIVGVGSVASTGLGMSSLLAMKGQKFIKLKKLWPLAVITCLLTLVATTLLPHLRSQGYQKFIGILLIGLSPTIFIKKSRFQPGIRSRRSTVVGYGVYSIIQFAGSFGSGLTTLLSLPLMFFMGMTALEASATRRLLGLLQSILIFIIVAPLGYVSWKYALVSLVGCWVGGSMGTKLAIKKGDIFVKRGLVLVMICSGIILLSFH